MSEFDLIFQVTNFQSIPYYCDNVRPDKNDSYRNEVNQTINELLTSEPPFEIIDANTKSRIKLVSGTRVERVQQCLEYIKQAGYKETIKVPMCNIANSFFTNEINDSRNQHKDMRDNFPPDPVVTMFNNTTPLL